MFRLSYILTAVVITYGTVHAHPGESLKSKRAEAKAKADFLASLENTDLAHCASTLASRGVVERTIERRRAIVNDLRTQGLGDSGLQKRQKFNFDTVLATTHKSKLNLGTTYLNADWALLGQNKSTVLLPESTEGPYYVTGEYIRKNVIEKETGIKLHLDIQVVDIKTCKPIPNVAMEIWGANATGVYSGVFDFMNFQSQNNSNQNNKALRGIQISDKDGAVQFETIIPGHYMGRTNHIHVLSHLNFTVLPNNTIQGGRIAHVGQIFFDQDLLNEMIKLHPYDKNLSPRMMNKNDFIMAFGARDGSDPVVEYIVLGNKLEDGVFAWINFGIDSKGNRTVRAAANCYESGCVPNSMGFPFDLGKGMSGLSDLLGKGISGIMDLLKDPSKISDLIGTFAKGFPSAKDGGPPGMGGLLPPGMSFPTELPKGLEMPSMAFPFPFSMPIGMPKATETKASAASPSSPKS